MLRFKHNKKGMETLIVLLGAVVIIGLISWFGVSQLHGLTSMINETLDEYNDCYKIPNSFCISPHEYCRDYDNSIASLGISCEEGDNPDETADMKCCTAINAKSKIFLELYDNTKNHDYVGRLVNRPSDYYSTGGIGKLKITEIEVKYPEYLYSKKINDKTTKFKLELIPMKTKEKCYSGDKPLIVKCDYPADGEFSFPSCGRIKSNVNGFNSAINNLDIGNCRFRITAYDEQGGDIRNIFTKDFDFLIKI